ncbi:MAG TPA: VOC family protein [Gammaproteobacteria bacterium]
MTRLHHVSLIVSDARRACGFYEGILGLPPITRPELGFPGLWYSLGEGLQLHLLELPNPDPVSDRPAHGGRDRHVALLVDDLGEMVRRLERAGIGYTHSRSGRAAIFCRDADGNGWELISAPANKDLEPFSPAM